MTATEVLQRTEEKMRLLGPVFGRLQTELLGPMMNRIFGLLVRHGKMVLPPGISFSDVRIEYVSPLSLAQKHLQARAVMQTLELAEGFLKIQPEAAAVFNVPEAIRQIGEMYGVSSALFNAGEEKNPMTENLKKKKISKALELVQAYKAVFLSENGQAVLRDLADKCHMLSPVTDVSNPNGFSAASAFYDGKRAAFLDIIKMSACDERKLVALLQETERNKNES